MSTRCIRRELEAELATQGITLRQWEVLAWLTLENGITQSELADRLGIEAPTLGGILDRMERDGWVERNGCPHDRRKKRLRATGKADSVWQRMVECAYRVRERATAGISDEEIQTLKKVCLQIRANLESTPITEIQPGKTNLNPQLRISNDDLVAFLNPPATFNAHPSQPEVAS